MTALWTKGLCPWCDSHVQLYALRYFFCGLFLCASWHCNFPKKRWIKYHLYIAQHKHKVTKHHPQTTGNRSGNKIGIWTSCRHILPLANNSPSMLVVTTIKPNHFTRAERLQHKPNIKHKKKGGGMVVWWWWWLNQWCIVPLSCGIDLSPASLCNHCAAVLSITVAASRHCC